MIGRIGLPAEFKYQQFIRQKILDRNKTVVIARPGSGKTRPIIDATAERLFMGGALMDPTLILCTGPAVPTWQRQIPLWLGDPEVSRRIYVATGPAHKRRAIWGRVRGNSGIIITNSSVFLRDFDIIQGVQWGCLIADEYHRYMRSRKSQTYARFLKLSKEADVVVLATGSSVSRNPSTMFTAFQIVDPRVFTSYWKFVNTFCIVDETAFGRSIVGVKNVENLKGLMDKYFAYVPEEVIADQQPEGRRIGIDVDMTPSQAKVYRQLSKEMIAEVEGSGEVIVSSTALSKLVTLRQLLCCPRAVEDTLDMGGGFEYIVEQLEDNPHAVIFVPFRQACICVTEALREHGFDVDYIRGGVPAEELTARIGYFREHGTTLVCTISYAESFDLETCDTSYFLGYDYSLDQNRQAEGRTQRAISQHKFVTWNYIKYQDTVDDALLSKLDEDMSNVKRILSRSQDFINALKGVA